MLMIRSLAYAEMRLVLANLALRFDLELQSESKQWMTQKLFTFWEKPPLIIKLRRSNWSN